MQISQDSAAEQIMNCINKMKEYLEQAEIQQGEFGQFKRCLIDACGWTYHLLMSDDMEIAQQLLDLLDLLENVIFWADFFD